MTTPPVRFWRIGGLLVELTIDPGASLPSLWRELFLLYSDLSPTDQRADVRLKLVPAVGHSPAPEQLIQQFSNEQPPFDLTVEMPGVTGLVRVDGQTVVGTLTVESDNSFGLFATTSLAVGLHTEMGNGLLLHASGVWRAGKVWLFCGPSGVGKTTIATKLSAGCVSFSDDRVLLEFGDDGRLWAHATPFGDERVTRDCPFKGEVAAIVFPTQGTVHQVASASLAACTRRLMEESRVFERSSYFTERAFEKVVTIYDRVPCISMTFAKDPGFWPALLSVGPD